MYTSKAYVYLRFYGEDFRPIELTSLINIDPTSYGQKGQRGQYGVYKECFWQKKLKKTSALDELDDSILKLISIFKDKIPSLKDFMKKHNVKAKYFVVIKAKNNEDVGVCMGIDVIRFLNELGASVEVDVYNC